MFMGIRGPYRRAARTATKEGHMYGLLLPSRPLQCPNCLSRDVSERRLLADDSRCLHPWHGKYADESVIERESGVRFGLCRNTRQPCSVASHWAKPACTCGVTIGYHLTYCPLYTGSPLGSALYVPPPSPPSGHECSGTYKTFAAAHCPYCKPKGKPDSTDDFTVESVAA